MSELRAALEAALGPIYRIEREVRPVGNCRLFVAVGAPAAPELLARGRARVADAGVVDALERALSGGASPPGAVRAALCAPAYLAPERRDDGAPGGPRDDMFAVGVLLHEMLTGRPPAGGPEGL